MRVGPDYILVNSFLWFSYFTKEGNLIKTLRLKNIYHGDQGFLMLVYDQEGNKLYTISRETEKIRVPQAFIKEVHDWFRVKFKPGLEWNKRNTVFPDYFPAIRDFQVAEKRRCQARFSYVDR